MTEAVRNREPAKTSQMTGQEVIAAAIAAAGEGLIVYLSISSSVSKYWLIAFHAGIVCTIAWLLFARQPLKAADPTVAYILLIVTAVSGPAGAFASLIMVALVGHAGAGPKILDAWYDRLAAAGGVLPETEVYNRIAAGRVINFSASLPPAFRDVIANGTLVEKQAALGLMARTFHTDFAPALQDALRSPQAVVRVQAAAVVARVRADMKQRIRTLLATGYDGTPEATKIAAELARYGQCALVDRADREKCQFAVREILHRSVTRKDVVFLAASSSGDVAAMLEAYLIEVRRFRDFRVVRRIREIMRRDRHRVCRRIRQRGVA